jgi:hypothetical protein
MPLQKKLSNLKDSPPHPGLCAPPLHPPHLPISGCNLCDVVCRVVACSALVNKCYGAKAARRPPSLNQREGAGLWLAKGGCGLNLVERTLGGSLWCTKPRPEKENRVCVWGGGRFGKCWGAPGSFWAADFQTRLRGSLAPPLSCA